MTDAQLTEPVELLASALMQDGSDLGECIADLTRALNSAGLTLSPVSDERTGK